MPDTFTMGRATTASWRAFTNAPVTEIIAISKEWAADVGWREAPRLAQPDRVFFTLSRFDSAVPQMEVSASAEDSHRSSVVFTASRDGGMWLGDLQSDLEKAVTSFARGVCQELGKRGYRVAPANLGEEGLSRAWRRRLEKLRRWAFGALLVAYVVCIPVGAVEHHNSLLFLSAWVWPGLLLASLILVHWRMVGIRARTLSYGLVIFVVVAAFITLMTALGG